MDRGCLLSAFFQVYVAAIHNRNLDLAEDLTKLYEIDHDLEAAMETEFLPQRHFQVLSQY